MITEIKVYYDVVYDRCLTVDKVDEVLKEVNVSYDNGVTYVFGLEEMKNAILLGALIAIKGMYDV